MWFKINVYSSRLMISVFVFFTLPVIGMGQHQGHQMPQTGNPTPTATPSPTPVVMTPDGIGIRVGSSETNVIAIGALGSGTSWQPSSGPMHMHHWTKGESVVILRFIRSPDTRRDLP